MAKKLDPMDLKQIITLQLDGLSNRNIGKMPGVSRNTVNSYMQMFKANSLGLRGLLEQDEAALQALFPAKITINNEIV